MTTNIHKTAQLGELVAAAFDKAALYSADPQEVSRLATQAVMNILRRAQRTSAPPSPLNHTHLRRAATLHGATIIT
jgi:hypothetical protein